MCIKTLPCNIFTVATDDTTLLSKRSKFDDLIDSTNNELTKKNKRACSNKHSLKINKTTFSVCSNKFVTDGRRVKIRNEEKPSEQFLFFGNNNRLKLMFQ